MNDLSDFQSPLKKTILLHLTKCKQELAEESYVIRRRHLCDFDRYLVSVSYKEGDAIDEPLVTGWLATHNNLSSSSIMLYTNSIRMFLRFYSYLNGERTYEPPLYQVDDSYVPYIFTDEEMDTIYSIVDNYPYGSVVSLPYIELEFPLVIRLLDTNGFRLNELITTKMTEVDLDNGVLKMVNTKKRKQRLVPLEKETTELLRAYCKAMNLHEKSEEYLFPRRKVTEPLARKDISERFHKVLVKAGIRQKRSAIRYAREACVHCLRHRFTMRAIKQLLSLGLTLENMTPFLSIYLGHDSISETEKYLKFMAEVFPEEMDKFSKEASKLLPNEDVWNDWM